jgi:hypothetical protein
MVWYYQGKTLQQKLDNLTDHGLIDRILKGESLQA